MRTFWNGLSSMQKAIFVLILVILIWVLWNRFKGSITAFGNRLQAGGEIAQLANQGIKPTYTAQQYNKMADDLFVAMDGYGTDSEVVFSTFKKLKNDADFIKLDSAFGVKTATDNLFGLMEAEDLSGWIKDDLSQTEIQRLNKQLANQGISKSF